MAVGHHGLREQAGGQRAVASGAHGKQLDGGTRDGLQASMDAARDRQRARGLRGDRADAATGKGERKPKQTRKQETPKKRSRESHMRLAGFYDAPRKTIGRFVKDEPKRTRFRRDMDASFRRRSALTHKQDPEGKIRFNSIPATKHP